MTINHLSLMVSLAKMPTMRAFYRTVLKPLGYTEMIVVSDSYVGFGSDYPYLWLRALPEGKTPVPVHVAIDAAETKEVDQFHELAMQAGATDNGLPGIRAQMSRQPYYSAYILDPDGNNLEAVCVKK